MTPSAVRASAKPVAKKKAPVRIKTLKALQNRDLEIMRYLAWGPSNVPSIARKFFPAREGDGESRFAEGQGKKKPISMYVFYRLKQLERGGYIQMKGDASIGESVVMLQRAGAVEVATRYGMEIENIRHVLPKPGEVLHDIMTASCIRTIYDEAETKELYKVGYVHTEYLTRRMAGGRQKRKGEYFPDFRVRVAPPRGEAVTFDVEIDSGTTGRSQIFAKIASFRNPTIIVTRLSERIMYLFQILQQDMARKEAKLPQIFFVLWSTFVRDGLQHSEVIQFPSGNRGVLPMTKK